MTDAQPVASIVLGFRVMSGTAEGVRFVRKLLPEPGEVEWTADREAALLFADRGQADLIRHQVVAHENRCAALVPAENRGTEWRS